MQIKSVINSSSSVGAVVTVSGWVKKTRNQKTFSFIEVNDGSCFDSLQVIADGVLENYADVLKLSAGCSVEVTGELVASSGANQTVEMQASIVKVLGFVADPESYPISPKPHSMEHLREHAHLRPRSNIGGVVARIRNTVSFAIHEFFQNRGFYWVATPIITASDCEGAGEMFRVTTLNGSTDWDSDFFGRETFLTVSGQLNGETYACGLSNIYTFGPTFRAENSNTSRHLAEFWMVEPEMAFCNLQQDAFVAADMLKHVVQKVLSLNESDVRFISEKIDKGIYSRLDNLLSKPFMHLSYTDGIDILKKSNQNFENPVAWGMDLASEHERFLAEEYAKAPVVLMNYPKEIKSFYMRLNDDGKTVAAMDILAPGIGEIIGGSQREERYDILLNRMVECGLNPESYSWYLDLRRYGTVEHAGFGLGLERLISYVTGIHNVRDVIPFPRTPKSISF